MISKALLVAALLAFCEARFGQEQIPVAAVQALNAFGNPGDAGTLSGQVPGVLLGGANACAKLQLADKIVETLGTDPQVIAAAQALVGAEKNTNPFAVAIPPLCSDAGLPATAELRGIVPLVDPATVGADVQNANAAQTLANPVDDGGLSVADLSAQLGFSNFTAQAADGATGAAPAGNGKGSSNNNQGGATASAPASASKTCGSAATVTVTAPANSNNGNNNNAGNGSSGSGAGAATGGGAVTQSTLGVSFGKCVPTMKFEPGLNGRRETEFTFQAIDPLVNKGQQEALNPNIIATRICDQLQNVCDADAAAKKACADAKQLLQSLGTRDVTTADAWNTALGFEGANTNPDNAPQPGLVGHT